MNERHQRLGQLLLLVGLSLALLDAWAGWQWSSSRQELALASDQASSCAHLAQTIERLRGAPAKVEETARTSDALAKLVEAAALQAGLSTDRIVHVAPSEPRRIGDSPYLEQATAVELRAITLRQLIEFSLALEQKAPRIKLPSVAIRTPPGEVNLNKGHELWNVQLTLTAQVFAPKMPTLP